MEDKTLTTLTYFPPIKLRRNVRKLTLIFMFFQILDGFFTYLGITALGQQAEGNWMYAYFFEHMGHTWSLILLKSTSIVFIFFIACHAEKIRIVKFVLVFSILFFFFFAIIPWALIIGRILSGGESSFYLFSPLNK